LRRFIDEEVASWRRRDYQRPPEEKAQAILQQLVDLLEADELRQLQR
jgi:hypothetical protein